MVSLGRSNLRSRRISAVISEIWLVAPQFLRKSCACTRSLRAPGRRVRGAALASLLLEPIGEETADEIESL
jgi:hypothetical protein